MFIKQRELRRWCALGAILAGGCSVMNGVQTRSVVHETFADFAGGKWENLSLSESGELGQGPSLELWAELPAPVAWKAVPDGAGGLYVATGNEGELYRVSADGSVEAVFRSDEILARALAADGKGRVYVGSSPEGKIYRIDAEGRAEVFFDPGDAYIWDLQFDPEGNLLIATGGDAAKVYRLPADATRDTEPDVLLESDRAHVTSMVQAPDGGLLVAVGPDALLYRISAEGTVELLHYDGGEELFISGPPSADGSIYFASLVGNPSGDKDGVPGPKDLPSLIKKLQTPEASGSSSVATDPSEEDAGSGGGGSENKRAPSFFYRLYPSGYVEPIWSPETSNITALYPHDARWLIGTSENGRLYEVAGTMDWKLLQTAANGGEITEILPDPSGDGAIVLTANPAAIYRLAPSPSSQISFRSPIIDAGMAARWGRLVLEGDAVDGPALSWSVRSGNSREPNDLWSDWFPLENGRIEAPAARFFQYQLEGKGEATGEPLLNLRQVRLFYNYFNAAPIVSAVNVLPVALRIFDIKTPPPPNINVNLNQLTSSKPSGARSLREPAAIVRQQVRVTGEPGFMSVGWDAFDPNGDSMTFDVFIRARGTTQWATLATRIEQSAYSFNTRGMEDGYYEVRVVASDAKQNLGKEALTGERLSFPFLVDNSMPEVTGLVVTTDEGEAVQFNAGDASSLIEAATLTIGGGEPYPIAPDDLIFDDSAETFTIPLSRLPEARAGLTVTLEVSDSLENRAIARVILD